jgi:hypothetical protein
MHYEQTFSNAFYVKIDPPAAEYWPVAATADWNSMQRKVRAVSWEYGINEVEISKAIVWFDDYVTGKIGFNILWVKNFD